MSEARSTPAGAGSAAGGLDWRSPSVISLVAANLVPIAGVLFLGWSVFSVVFLFWLENVIIGLFTIARILCARSGPPAAGPGGKVFLAAFFTFHYGMFCFVHGVLVIAIFGSKDRFHIELERIVELLSETGLLWAALGLAASHGVSFVTNFIGRREFATVTAQEEMGRPYGRIVVLHIAIIAGGWVVMAIGAPAAGLLILIVLKIALDLRAHVREHARIRGGGWIED